METNQMTLTDGTLLSLARIRHLTLISFRIELAQIMAIIEVSERIYRKSHNQTSG